MGAKLLKILLFIGFLYTKTLPVKGSPSFDNPIQKQHSLSSLTAATKIHSPKNIRDGEKSTIPHLMLSSQPNYAITLPLIKSSVNAYADEIFQERGTTKTGWFVVEAPEKYGIMAIIQELHIPPRAEAVSDSWITKLIDNDTTNGPQGDTFCSDYIQFGELNGPFTSAICGTVASNDDQPMPQNLVGIRSFKSRENKLAVLFKFGDVEDLLLYHYNQLALGDGKFLRRTVPLQYTATVAFTAYKDCSNGSNESLDTDNIHESNISLFSLPNTKYLYPCSTENKDTCIGSGLLCNNQYNCGDAEDFGSDEEHCNHHHQTTNSVTKDGIMRVEGDISHLPPYYREALIPAAANSIRKDETINNTNNNGSSSLSFIEEFQIPTTANESASNVTLGFRIYRGINIFIIVLSFIIVLTLVVVGLRICCVNCVEDVNKSCERRQSLERVEDWERPIVEVIRRTRAATPVASRRQMNLVESSGSNYGTPRSRRKIRAASPPPMYGDLFPDKDGEMDLDLDTEKKRQKGDSV